MERLVLLLEASGHSGEDLGNGKWKYQGKVGVWRTAKNGDKMFFPDDGSGPLGAAQTLKHGEEEESLSDEEKAILNKEWKDRTHKERLATDEINQKKHRIANREAGKKAKEEAHTALLQKVQADVARDMEKDGGWNGVVRQEQDKGTKEAKKQLGFHAPDSKELGFYRDDKEKSVHTAKKDMAVSAKEMERLKDNPDHLSPEDLESAMKKHYHNYLASVNTYTRDYAALQEIQRATEDHERKKKH
jgi:hypothetical protein